ncbi:MAG TPA: phage protease [Solirubrobacterales bacterium]|jgi:hypothetical protein
MAAIDIDRIASVVVPGASDSRPCMKEIAKLLGLDEAATEEQILEALKARTGTAGIAKALDLKEDAAEQEILDAIKAKAEPETESLEDKAKAEGKIVLDAKDVAALQADSKAGKEAADKLHQRDFDDAFTKALDAVRVDAKDETRETYQKLYDKAPEETIEILEKLPKLANTSGRGGSGDGGSGKEAPDNVDEDRFELNEKVEARMAADDCDYAEALRKVRAEEKV